MLNFPRRHLSIYRLLALSLAAAVVAAGCAGRSGQHAMRTDSTASPVITPAPAGSWAIAIHGGAGTLDRSTPPEKLAEYRAALAEALKLGTEMLAAGRSSLDTCEAVVRRLEDDPKFNAGKGAVYTEIGTHELDASIMDGRELACGAVAGVRTVRNPISLARAVMEKSGHVLLMGDGAEQFADAMGVDRVPNTYFDTPHRYEQLQKKLKERAAKPAALGTRAAETRETARANPDPRDTYGTVGCVCLDNSGNLAAATSTGGLTAKRFGRVGDAPIIGAGCFADNRSAAISCSGTGEEFIRHTVSRDIAALVEHRGWSLQRAAEFVVNQRLKPDDGGIIAVSRRGEVAIVYNSEGMYRGAATSRQLGGRFEVGIFED